MWTISEDDLVDPVTSDLFIRTLSPDPGEEKDRGGEGIRKKKKKKTAWRPSNGGVRIISFAAGQS